MGARSVTCGPALAEGLCRGRVWWSMFREMMLSTNLHILQVMKMEPRMTIICPASQVVFTLPREEFRFIVTGPQGRKIKQEIRVWGWMRLLGGDLKI